MQVSKDGRALGDVAVVLQRLLLSAEGVEEFLDALARQAADVIPGAIACGITVAATPRTRPLAATSDEFAQRIGTIQSEVADGPSSTCLRYGLVVALEDVGADIRWPAFSRRAREEGLGASLSIPILVYDVAVGVLNLYSPALYALRESDSQRARRFADQAAGAVALAQRLSERGEQTRNLENALMSRSIIDQAIGIVMAQARISAPEAFAVLKGRSQNNNTKLRDVAAALVIQTSEPNPTGET